MSKETCNLIFFFLIVFYVFPFLQYSGINIGPVHRKDVMKASVMLEHDSQ